MKKLFSLILALNFIFSCKNSGTTTVSKDSSSGPNMPAINNVNGNVPDTSSGMTLNRSLPMDSSRLKDSARH